MNVYKATFVATAFNKYFLATCNMYVMITADLEIFGYSAIFSWSRTLHTPIKHGVQTVCCVHAEVADGLYHSEQHSPLTTIG